MEETLPIPARAQATMTVKSYQYGENTKRGDTAWIQRAYDQLRAENIARDKALTNLSEIVKEYGSSTVNICDPTR